MLVLIISQVKNISYFKNLYLISLKMTLGDNFFYSSIDS